jgi:hypothetical protein
MDIQATHEFVAHGEMTRNVVSIPVTIVGKYPSYGLGSVECKFVIETANWPPKFGDPFDYQNPIQLSGKTEGGLDIWSPEFRLTKATRGLSHEPSSGDPLSMEGTTAFFVEGNLGNFNASKGKTVCVVSLTPTPLALLTDGYYLRYWDGTITRRNKTSKTRKGIRWKTRLGQAELIDNYEYIDERVGFNVASIQVQKCQITIKVGTRRRNVSLRIIISELEKTLEEPLLILSFLSRQSVSWYEAKAAFLSKDYATEVHRDAIARRQQNLFYDSEIDIKVSRLNVPVEPQALQEGLFQTILDAYIQSPLHTTIRQAIQYLLLSYERGGYFEARLGLIYAALESLVDGLSKHHGMTYLMGGNRFKKLSKELEGSIFKKLSQILEEVIQEKVPEEEIAKGIIGKLPELRRPPIRERLLKLLEIYKLSKIRMSSDINTAIEGILTRRNAYIHTGAVDYDKHFNDFFLLQELIEIWILTLLDCPDTAISRRAFRHIIL